MKDLIIKISASKITKLTKDVAKQVEENYDNDFKYESKGLKILEQQIRKGIKEAIFHYVLGPDMFIDNGLLNFEYIPTKSLH